MLGSVLLRSIRRDLKEYDELVQTQAQQSRRTELVHGGLSSNFWQQNVMNMKAVNVIMNV